MVKMETHGFGWRSRKEKRDVCVEGGHGLLWAMSGQEVRVGRVNERRMVEPPIHSFIHSFTYSFINMSNISLGVWNPMAN